MPRRHESGCRVDSLDITSGTVAPRPEWQPRRQESRAANASHRATVDSRRGRDRASPATRTANCRPRKARASVCRAGRLRPMHQRPMPRRNAVRSIDELVEHLLAYLHARIVKQRRHGGDVARAGDRQGDRLADMRPARHRFERPIGVAAMISRRSASSSSGENCRTGPATASSRRVPAAG
jgi:hypothetical protein